jgi:AraC-like DNA-binding protein
MLKPARLIRKMTGRSAICHNSFTEHSSSIQEADRKAVREGSWAMLQTRSQKPARGIEQYVRFYAQRDIQIRGVAVVQPVPARTVPMIVFDFHDSPDVFLCKQKALVKSPLTVVVGPQTYRRLEMQLCGTLDTFAIMFQPDGLHRLFSLPMQELTDQDFEAHSVLGRFVSHMRERLGNSGSFEERVGLVNQFLLQQVRHARSFDAVSAAANQIILASGCIGIPALADRSGLSMRQFERRFIQQVGMRPKLFARIARFEAALDNKARFDSKSWTDVAHEFGYYDQMHMVHDFGEFFAGTPTEMLAVLETVFVEELKRMRPTNPSKATVDNSRLVL